VEGEQKCQTLIAYVSSNFALRGYAQGAETKKHFKLSLPLGEGGK